MLVLSENTHKLLGLIQRSVYKVATADATEVPYMIFDGLIVILEMFCYRPHFHYIKMATTITKFKKERKKKPAFNEMNERNEKQK